jgi:hypothetical protein
LLPNRYLTLWPYSDLNDPRISWGTRYKLLQQDETVRRPFKFGLSVPGGWAAYAHSGSLFLKRFTFQPDASYPDNNVNVELYTNHRFLELESLGPLRTLAPRAFLDYEEEWRLFKDVGPVVTEADVERVVAPLMEG